MKTCRKCGALFDERHCKACAAVMNAARYQKNKEKMNAASAAYRLKNKERLKEQRAAYRAANKEKLREQNAKYYANNKEKFKAYQALTREETKVRMAIYRQQNKDRLSKQQSEYKAAHREQLNEQYRQYYANNVEVMRMYTQNRRARKIANGGVLSKGLAQKLFKLQRGKCACCGKPLGENYHLDHRMPLALGGANEDWNMQLLTRSCNSKKSARHPVDFMQSKGFLL